MNVKKVHWHGSKKHFKVSFGLMVTLAVICHVFLIGFY